MRRKPDTRAWPDKARYNYPLSIALCLLLWYALVCCGGGDSVTAPATSTLSMDASAWSFRYSPGMPSSPFPAVGGGWQFDFPQQDGVHYLTAPLTSSVLGKTVTVTTQIIGEPVYTWAPNECTGTPATAHIMIEKQGDDLIRADGRWWSDVPVPLTVGKSVVSVPIVEGRWTNVYGQINTPGFYDAMTHPGFIGLTFGGGCYYGHGIWMQSGIARMIVRDFTIQ